MSYCPAALDIKGTVRHYLLRSVQQLLSTGGGETKPMKPDHPLICSPFPTAILSPPSLPYNTLTAQEKYAAACPQMPTHWLSSTLATNKPLSEQHHLESHLYLNTDFLESNGT